MTANPFMPPPHAVTSSTAARWLGNRYPRHENEISAAISDAQDGRTARVGAYHLVPAQAAGLVISLGPQAAAFAAGPVPRQMLEASRHAGDWVAQAGGRDVAAAGIPMLTAALDACRSGAEAPLGHDEAAWLLAFLSRTQPRNHAWNQMTPRQAPAHARLWAALTRRAPHGYAADAAALLAFTSLQAGDTVTADAALMRAAADNPRHKVTRVLRAAMTAGLPAGAYQPTPSARTDPGQMLRAIVSRQRQGPAIEQ